MPNHLELPCRHPQNAGCPTNRVDVSPELQAALRSRGAIQQIPQYALLTAEVPALKVAMLHIEPVKYDLIADLLKLDKQLEH